MMKHDETKIEGTEADWQTQLDIKNSVIERLERALNIEAALERVRARTMAMQKSSELSDAAYVLFQQFQLLGENPLQITIGIINEKERVVEFSVTDWRGGGGLIDRMFKGSLDEPTFINKSYRAWKEGKKSLVIDLQGSELEGWLNYRDKISDTKVSGDDTHGRRVISAAYFSKGHLSFSTPEPRPRESILLLERFAVEFDLTYTRFLDLQKAEAQTKEAQIEAALERVRSRAMAMQNSNELGEIVDAVFKELTRLHFSIDRCIIMIFDAETNGCTWWLANPEPGLIPVGLFVKYGEYEPYLDILKAWKSRMMRWQYLLDGTNKKEWDDFLFSETELSRLPEVVIAGMKSFDRIYLNTSFNNFGCLTVSSVEPFPDENFEILLRFAKVFDSTYTRFNDLKQAEAQARESQIQLALERVRARTMAMQRSDELAEVAISLFQQVKNLGIKAWTTGFNIWQADNEAYIDWITGPTGDFLEPYTVYLTSFPVFKAIREAKQRGDDFFVSFVEGEQAREMYQLLNSFGDKGQFQKILDSGFSFPTHQYNHFVFGAQVSLMFITYEPYPEAWDIYKRFGKVFEQTYTRFLDLKKAEDQSRESQIEAALERVRSRSMGMQKTDELREIIQVIYAQMVQLNIPVDQAGFVMDYKETDGWNIWIADQIGIPSKSYIPYFDSPQWTRFIEAKQKGEDSFNNSLTFEEKNHFFQMIFKYVTGVPEEVKEFVFSRPGFATSNALLKYVCLFVNNFSGVQYSNEENAVVMRFARVFEQTYIRFNDLKQAEALTRETVQRASVDRIRAEIASMRTTKDLERITPLIWNELTTVGVPFVRCGVFIMDEEKQHVNTFLSTPEGKGVAAAFHLPYNANRETTEIVAHWNRKEMYKPHWDEAAFIDFTKVLAERGAVTTGEKFLVESRPNDLYLHFIPFLQGMLYVGDNAPLCEEHLQLVQALAEAFSTAYSRYDDFNKLESAKLQIEKTLVDLKLAQSQLVQAEKMASLGELTAGIAHEIQNPLNFVNNFSEVNQELIAEMKDELLKGNMEEVVEMVQQLGDNEEKILHHGKRADAIVKSMLQHSRTSTNTKEPTDINALADEYLRLAYHGMRSKDKSFNTAMQTDFDASIGLIPLIQQDIGRVLLNVYNNAFYAVHEKKRKIATGYEPCVSVSTKKLNGELEIRVKDNGNGIPDKVKDKIFQPFFTTKPTGQGTGLGLSLSYDIVKAQGGDIKLETKESEGSEFIVQLPLN